MRRLFETPSPKLLQDLGMRRSRFGKGTSAARGREVGVSAVSPVSRVVSSTAYSRGAGVCYINGRIDLRPCRHGAFPFESTQFDNDLEVSDPTDLDSASANSRSDRKAVQK